MSSKTDPDFPRDSGHIIFAIQYESPKRKLSARLTIAGGLIAALLALAYYWARLS